MDDTILKQLEIFTNKGIDVQLISADKFQISGKGMPSWFRVLTETLETTDSGGHSKEPFEVPFLAECLVKRFHKNWMTEVERKNSYIRPDQCWCQLFEEFNLPYRLKLV